MAHIVIIEDEADLRRVIEFNLEQAGHTVTGVDRGEDGLRIVQNQRPALVLLDIMLPDVSGTQVCRAVKSHPDTKSTPVILVTAKSDEIDRVVGFEVGADDYVVKPFSMRELLLRVAAILRRNQRETTPTELQGMIEFGRLRMDRGSHRVWVDGAEVSLTALEFRLLLTLHDRRDRVQTRDELLNRVWGIQANDSTSRTVDTHVKRLREKLEAARDYIETVRGVGYRFVASPEKASA